MRGLCDGLGVPLFELTDPGSGFVRYLRLGARTWKLIRQARPQVVIVQNPSLILAALACLARLAAGHYRLIIDAHNEAVEPFINTRWPVPQVGRWVMRKADLTIVTNAELANVVAAHGGTPFVLPDRLPEEVVEARPLAVDGVFEVMVVATYAPDEPISEVIEAARLLGGGFRLSFTGRESRMNPDIRKALPGNVRLTGFLSEEDYWATMAASHVVLDLSLMPNCLVCGAYEALALGRPLILSTSSASQRLFGGVAVLTRAATEDVTWAIREAQRTYPNLVSRLPEVRSEFRRSWEVAASILKGEIQRP